FAKLFGSSFPPRLLTVAMVKRAHAPSASSALRSSVVLSRAVEKTFALEAEVSRLRHHVSILSRRLHCTAKELSTLRASRDASTPTDPPSSPAVSIVTVLGGGLDPESPRAFGGLAEELPRRDVAPAVIPPSPPPFEVVVGVGGPDSNFDSDWDEAPPLDCGGWRRTLWRCQLWWCPLRRRCLSLPWLSPWLIETMPLVALWTRLLVTM